MTLSYAQAPPRRLSPLAQDMIALALMWGAVVGVYWRPKQPGGSQLASDFYALHVYRMSFAREMLFEHGTLPGWYPRELLGTPFWSNIQSFPFLPTRLLMLSLDPVGPYTYTLAISLAALLAATFTYLFTRRIGMGPVGAAAAGWTFVCCGYFASRVGAGHLPLLEVYGALPLLLWCVESMKQAHDAGRPIGRWIAALGVSSMCVMLAGHPQLPVYALATAGFYALWRFGLRRGWVALSSMALGVGSAAFVLVPMAMLVGRSTRVLPLIKAGNDLAIPYRRLLGFFLPWLDGAAVPLPLSRTKPFIYPEQSYFWDTFNYAGWAPWIAAVFLLVLLRLKRIRLSKPGLFLLGMGIAGIILALPIVQQMTGFIPGTFLRSPARLIYLTELSLAIALGAAVHWLLQRSTVTWARAAIGLALAGHVLDVSLVARRFDVRSPTADPQRVERAIAPALVTVRDGRIAMDAMTPLPSNRRHDDVGFFDSIILAKPYALMIDLTGAPADLNEQLIDGSYLSPRALEAAGVKFVFTFNRRQDLKLVGELDDLNAYQIENPAPRAAFFPHPQIDFADDAQLRSILRDPATDVFQRLILPQSAFPPPLPPDTSTDPPQVVYSRPGPDRIECVVTTGQFGYLRIIESWDPGWSATVNGMEARIVPALGALLAVPLGPGQHRVVFEFHTPGRNAGLALSLLCLLGLSLLTGWARKRALTHPASVAGRAESARSAGQR